MKKIILAAGLLMGTALADSDLQRGVEAGPRYCGDPNSTSAQRRGRADTLYTRVSDGRGGTWRRTLEVSSPQCTGDSTPPRGTFVGPEYCGEGYGPNNLYTTLYTRVSNGRGGTYRAVVETNSPQCPAAVVTQVTEVGDRFVPVTFEIEAPEGYTYEATLGNVTTTNTGLSITGDGRFGTGYITIAGQEYSYDIVEEPRCSSSDSPSARPDCLGYSYRGPSEGFIYYGETDTTVVQWEMGYIIFDDRGPLDQMGDVFEKGSKEWNLAQTQVDRYNEIYRRSGVHVEFVLKEGAVGRASFAGPSGSSSIMSGLGTVDVYIAKGNTCPNTCGCAYATNSFSYNTGKARGGVSVCGIEVDLHEIGHSLGLAHGPDNRFNEERGYIWPNFGHGHSGGILCGADLMSYEDGSVQANSEVSCQDIYDAPRYQGKYEGDENPSGDRTISDTAYHLNRVRYDVSLISCAAFACSEAPKSVALETEEVLVEDEIEHIPNGWRLFEEDVQEVYDNFIRP